MSRIELVVHPDAFAIHQAWEDAAHIEGKERIQRTHWYVDKELDQTYYDIFGCLGWPTEFSDHSDSLPGYVALVGVVRPKRGDRAPEDAVFQLLTERESLDVPTLISMTLDIRDEYGFGLTPGFLETFYGDTDRFVMPLALVNEGLVKDKGERAALLITPPDGFYDDKVFDTYVRAFKSVLVPDRLRFYFGRGNDILRTRIKGFKQGDPAVLAIGGLIYSLLDQTMWMEGVRDNAFVIENYT